MHDDDITLSMEQAEYIVNEYGPQDKGTDT